MENLPERFWGQGGMLKPSSIMIEAAAEWFKLDVANGDARSDTIATYVCHIGQWFAWCDTAGVDPGSATQDHLKSYRAEIVGRGAKHSTVQLKLSVIRRFYQGAVDRGLLKANPVADVKAPRDRRAYEKLKHLTAEETELLFRSILRDDVRALRDRAMLMLMTLEGLRRVEITRMNVADLVHFAAPHESKILVRGKGKDSYIYPRPDTAEMITAYLRVRGKMESDRDGEPLFTAIDKGATPRRRLSRIGLNGIVDGYLRRIGIKKAGISCHALRHTCGHLVYHETKDLRVVQEVLRHGSPVTSAKYSDVEAQKNRHTQSIPISATR